MNFHELATELSDAGFTRAAPAAPGPLLDGWIDEWQVLHRSAACSC